jgi:putative redox protein
MKVIIRRVKNLQFEGINSEGQKVLMDGKPPFGEGTYPSPVELLLMALGGCTGMDVISILEKKRLKPEEFTIEIEGVRKQTHPRVFTQIKILYRIKGNIPSKAVEQAIKLSMEKYCSVSAMLKSVVNIQWDYVIEN